MSRKAGTRGIFGKRTAVNRLLSGVTVGVCVGGLIGSGGAIAQDAAQAAVSENPIDREALEALRSQLTNLDQLPLLPSNSNSLDADSTRLSSTELSAPRFAWIRAQTEDRYYNRTLLVGLVERWSAYTNQGLRYVDVVVDQDAWEQLSYVRRYGFLVQFGTAAQNNRYQRRIFHSGDVSNRLDELSAQNSPFGMVAGSAVRLRGAYYCTQQATPVSMPSSPPSVAQTAPRACGAFLSPLIKL